MNEYSFDGLLGVKLFYGNGEIMGAIDSFASAFGFLVETLNESTYSLKNLDGDELILTSDSDKAVYNGEHITLNAQQYMVILQRGKHTALQEMYMVPRRI